MAAIQEELFHKILSGKVAAVITSMVNNSARSKLLDAFLNLNVEYANMFNV